ncbi:MAG: DNA-binding protein WhiA, partial [Anaerotardibacter sp.]
MSFSTEVKEELIEIQPQCPHCNEALLSALLRINGTLLFSGRGSVRLEVTTEVPFVARLITDTLTDVYNLQVVITVRQNVLHKTPNWLIEVPYQKNLEEVLEKVGILKKEGALERGISPVFKENPCCFNSYVRGLFLGSGFVSDPKGNFHLEIKIDSEYLAEEVATHLQTRGIEGVSIPVRTTPRRNSTIIYLKSGEHIATFMKALKAEKAYKTIQEARSTKNVRNAVNRQVNAEIANSNKSGAASQKQIATIRR